MTTKQKLRKLADFLDNEVKDAWFDLGYWAKKGFLEKQCGTTACAAGWATVCFPKSGLTLCPRSAYHPRSEELVVSYGRARGIVAVMEFFGFNGETARYLFLPSEYPHHRRGRRSVAKRLREVANRKDVNVREWDDD